MLNYCFISQVFYFAEYENAFNQETCNLPDLICIITGKGPLKEFYVAIIKLKNWKHITIVTPWLENEDYPKMLGTEMCSIFYSFSPKYIYKGYNFYL